jgi:transcriptional regulator with XRE-family HTH domain
MNQIELPDNPQTLELLHAMKRVMQFIKSMDSPTRQRFLHALAECSDELQEVTFQMLSVVENEQSTPSERKRALMTIADALFLNPDTDGDYGMDLVASESLAAEEFPRLASEVERMDSQETTFAERLRELMTSKNVTQQELADRVGCSQPAISQVLNRKCRPQKRTILKVAEALSVHPRELWPDLEVAEMLDAVASFQQDEYVMTEAEAEAEALKDTSKRNSPKIPIRPLRERS